MKESFPRPRKPASAARRENAVEESEPDLDDAIARARARLGRLLARTEGEPADEAAEPERNDYRARRFRPKAELEPAEPRAERKADPSAPGPVERPESGAEGPREIAPPPPRETVPAEFREPEPGPDAPKHVPFWSEAEPSTTAQVAGRWEQRYELKRIPAGLWMAFLVAALLLGGGLGWALRGKPEEAARPKEFAAASPTPTPRAVMTASVPSVAAAAPRKGAVVQIERPTREFATSPAMGKFNEAAAAESDGRLEVAQRLLNEAAALTPRPPGIALRLGFLATRRGDLAAATEHFKQAVALGEGAAVAATQLALMHADIRSWEAAEEWLLIAITLEPLRARHFLLWGDFARRQGLTVQALARYQIAQKRELDPAEFSVLRVRIALAELERGNGAEIERFLSEAGEEQRKMPDWSMMAAAAALQRGDMEQAAEHLRAARAGYSLPLAAVQAKDIFFAEFHARPVVGSLLRDMSAMTAKEKEPAR